MGIGGGGKADAVSYYTASGIAAIINFPLWKASAIGQSGFQLASTTTLHPSFPPALPPYLSRYLAAMAPPYKGVFATWAGMCWARATIFYGSERGKELLRQRYGVTGAWAGALPALVTSTFVQLCNMPIIRATITVQNPASPYRNTTEALRAIYEKGGVKGLWLGTSAGIMKTVPKYMTAVVVKDKMEEWLDPVPENADNARSLLVQRSAVKAVTAGLAGAVLTNPLDVVRNECFKREQSLGPTLRGLVEEEGARFLWRGMGKNVVAVTIPVAATIFLADMISRARGL
ncbi:hypothetical protein NSK_008807 [Nannochloropsis salina CCMP1776]|uniref:Mitochondrial carrier protein n=1 Tax=Nannochloropsis salina CCMP1776 TaxID=1027361 RepID=A0A4D9CQN5_9STRA|nr:hypothetical protein NSK_008807 [Nannochloropsis salina CCMP1776]|eukprot:TFJ79873.1 hypothetical protein NSK_008807 [Nannochloropsis salina CCMP1776]